MSAFAVIVAGGKGLRMGGECRKQYLSLAGKPILYYTLSAFDHCPEIEGIVLVLPETDIAFCREKILPQILLKKPLEIVHGGDQRQDSVYQGLMALDRMGAGPEDIVAIHDGVRPFVRAHEIRACVREAERGYACILALPAFDTVKMVDPEAKIAKTLSREELWLAQTPQCFPYEKIRNAHEAAREKGYIGTDDSSLLEGQGETVKVIPGSRYNIKITTPEDLPLAEAICRIYGL